MCRIPSSVTTGKVAKLTCHDGDGSPPPTYKWYKDSILMPTEPSKIAGFQNATYKLNAVSGNLVSFNLLLCRIFTLKAVVPMAFKMKRCTLLPLQEYPAVTKMDSGQYYCEAVNDAGPPQRCKGLKMEVCKCFLFFLEALLI